MPNETLVHVNTSDALRKIVGCPDSADDLVAWMSNNKTEAALAIAEADTSITYPDYFQNTLDFLA